MRSMLLVIMAGLMVGCVGQVTWTYEQASGASGHVDVSGELLTKTDSFSIKRADGSGYTVGKSDQSIVVSGMAWGAAAKAAGTALDGSVSEVIDAVKK